MELKIATPCLDYEILDSGGGFKLERVGSVKLIRPSSLAIWNKLHPSLWKGASAEYVPGKGWSGNNNKGWEVTCGEAKIIAYLQENGQIGLFPEHSLYFGNLKSSIFKISDTVPTPKVLNLFAFTGLATIFCALNNCQVTHVDLAKRAVDLARNNCEINHLKNHPRLINEDVMAFMGREARRGSKYDIIILDPPSFSRVSTKKNWQIEEVLSELISVTKQCLSDVGEVYFTSHSQFPDEFFVNLVMDFFAPKEFLIQTKHLAIKESKSERFIPGGILLYISKK